MPSFSSRQSQLPRGAHTAPSWSSPTARISAACFASWCLLTAAQRGWVPGTRFAWAFNLWGYLPEWVGFALACGALVLGSARVRAALASEAEALQARVARGPQLAVAFLGYGALLLAFWTLRERLFLGDSGLLVTNAQVGSSFIFPEMGTTFLMRAGARLGRALHVGPHPPIQLGISLCGTLAVAFLLRAARHLAPTDGARIAVVGLVLSGGLLRVFAGHIEVYAPLVAAVSAYFWLALECLAGRRGLAAPCLALGVAICLHAAGVCLLPSLLVLAALVRQVRERTARTAVQIAVLTAAPTLVLLLGIAFFAPARDFAVAWEKALQILGRASSPDAVRWWVRGWGGAPSIGTDVVWLSWPHLKYLVNAGHVLVPATVPTLLVLALSAPRRLVASPTAVFLGTAAIPCLIYATLLRPFWGPFDWDLFCLTGLVLALLAGHLLAVGLDAERFRHVVTWLIGFQLLFVGIPFLAIGVGVTRPVGPFVPENFQHIDLVPAGTPPPEHLAPWL